MRYCLQGPAALCYTRGMNGFRYADTSAWEEWQREYSYGALYIFPPAGVIEAVDALRGAHDPRSATYCQAHISLSEPLKHPCTASDVEELHARLSSIEPFEIHYGPLRSFPPYPGVTYAITPEDKFGELRAAIHSTSIFAGVPLRREHIAPHMTIAEFITVERTAELLEELRGNVPEGAFFCDAVEYAIPNNEFSFERVLTIPLGETGVERGPTGDALESAGTPATILRVNRKSSLGN